MWINTNLIGLRSLWQNASYRRLAVALALSLLLHLFLIGKFYIDLPDLNDSHHVIEARLVLSKSSVKPVEAKSVETKSVEARPAVRAAEPPKLVSDILKSPENLPQPSDAPIATESAPLPQPVEPPRPSDIIAIVNEPMANNQAEETDLITNRNPYKYIETDFDVYTDKQPSLGSSPAGKATIIYQALHNGERYRIKSLIQAKGLAALFMPDLLQTSDGYLYSAGLQPAHYLYQFGDKKNKTFSADFDWESKKINLHGEQNDQRLDLSEGTQDLLSFMYQFMFVPPLQNLQLNITNGKKLGVYIYSFEGEETITTKMGDLKTVHLQRMVAESEKRTELWLALDYQYVPVKIRETEKEGKVYELLANSLKTEFSAPPVP